MNKSIRKIRGVLGPLFTFTPSQVRGVVVLMPLLAVFGVIIGFVNRPHFEKSFLELADSAADSEAGITRGGVKLKQQDSVGLPELFVFDPNTATLQDFCRLGLDTRTAAGIIKYRERGKRFEIPEDFVACYGVTLEDYSRLAPYIHIGDAFRLRPASGQKIVARADDVELRNFYPDSLDAGGFVSLGFSPKQAETIVRYRRSIGGFQSLDDFARCYVVSGHMVERLAPYMIFVQAAETVGVGLKDMEADSVYAGTVPVLVELNGADSAELRSVSGIGEVLVVRIMEYRDRLGGFVRPEQLAEVRGMFEDNMQRICEQIRVDSCEIQKIDINFAPHKTLVERLGRHPYVTEVMLRKLLKNRQLKGGWSNIGEMVEQDILTSEDAERLSPYLLFRSE